MDAGLRLSGAALAVLLVAGCVTSGREFAIKGEQALAERAGAAKPIHLIDYTPLPFGEPLELELNQLDQVVALDSDVAFTKAFALPQWTVPASLKVKSFRVGAPQDPAILYPVVIFLDEAFRETRRSEARQFVYRREGFNEGDGLSATFFLNESNRNERYVLVMSRRKDADGSMSLSTHVVQITPVVVPVGAGSITWMIPTGGQDFATPMAASPSGKLKLHFEEYRPQRMESAVKSP